MVLLSGKVKVRSSDQVYVSRSTVKKKNNDSFLLLPSHTEPEPIDGVHFFIKKDVSLRLTDIPGALFRPVAVPGRRALGLVRRGIPQGQNKRKIAAHGDTV